LLESGELGPIASGEFGMRGEAAIRLREALENDIVSGKLRPGERLDETELAERFGVSRTPIREALIQLAGSGMIELRPRRGAHVTLLGPRELLEAFEFMGELESACARFAARRMTAGERETLISAFKRCRKACEKGDVDAYYHANADFHGAIYDASHNRALALSARNQQRMLQPYRRLQLRVRGRLASSFDEHDTVMEALLAGNGMEAGERLRVHVVVQGERFMSLLAELQVETAPAPRAKTG
jgi:DNA-binding GntR family transcriptional regulator